MYRFKAKCQKYSLVAMLAIFTFVGFSAMAQNPDMVGDTNQIAEVALEGESIVWYPNGAYEMIQLSVAGPNGWHFSETFSAGKIPSLSLYTRDRFPLPYGSYKYELGVVQEIPDYIKDQVESARAAGDQFAVNAILQDAGVLDEPVTQFGIFNLADNGASLPTSRSVDSDTDERDNVINDDVIIPFSLCVGTDCANGENFGFDTIRLKENNLRIKFDDTSNSGSFPFNDWQLIANDSDNGGANYFGIEDVTGGKIPFRVEAGAPNHALYVEDSGEVGFGTSSPAVSAHIVDGDSPTLRLEQNASSGFTPQTWDVVGNEANFFVRDVTNGSKLSFRIRPGAPESSIDIKGNGNVGIGYDNPQYPLHIRRTDGTARLHIEETGTEAIRTMLSLHNNGRPLIELMDTSADGETWQVSLTGGNDLSWSAVSNSGNEMRLTETGELFVADTVYANNIALTSDRNKKENFETIDAKSVLDQVSRIPVLSWNYKTDGETRHIGPMAQDFYAAFQVGAGETTISPMDLSSVTMAAVQGLYEIQQEKEAEIEELKTRNADLEKRLAALEAALLNK